MSDLLTIPMVKDMFPDGGPSERCLRETAQRLGLGVRIGRKFYLTETDFQCLLASASVENTGTPEAPSRPRKPTAQSDASVLKKALELSRRPRHENASLDWPEATYAAEAAIPLIERALLEEMRKPTDAMCMAWDAACNSRRWDYLPAADAWEVMIDAFAKETRNIDLSDGEV